MRTASLALVLLVSCAPDPEPPKAPAPAAVPKAAGETAKAPAPPKTPIPAPLYAAAEPQSASIVFRTTDNRRATVFINGRRATETGGLWSVSDQTEFDPAVPVGAWPPPKTKHGARAVKWDESHACVIGTIEARVAGGRYPEEPREALVARVPHLDPDEQVLYVKAEGGGRCWTGAVRVKVVDADGAVYRHVNFHPPDSDEDANAHRWRSSVWFER